jgi:hypothetical protein
MSILKKIAVSMIVIIVLLSGCVQKPISTPTKTSEPTPETPGVEQLKVVGQIGGQTRSITVSGKYAYVGVGMIVMVLDISNPDNPSEIGSTQPFEGDIRDIAISGNIAYGHFLQFNHSNANINLSTTIIARSTVIFDSSPNLHGSWKKHYSHGG